MRIFVISLLRDQDRRTRMRSLLDPLHLNYEFVDAVDGRALTEAELSQFQHRRSMGLGPGEYGCLLSHKKVWQRIVSERIDCALILEDDVHFSSGFVEVLDRVQIDGELLGLYRLETPLASVNVLAKESQRIGKHRIFRLLSNCSNTAGYVVNLKTAEFLDSVAYSMQGAIDTELFSPERRTIPAIDVFQCVPGVCIQDTTLGQSGAGLEFLGSRIEAEREDVALGFRKPKPQYITMIKTFFRPAYLALYSIFVCDRGCRRIRVGFG